MARMTKAAVAQWGPSTCPVTEALSSASDCRAETACHEAFLVSTFGCPRGALRFLANGLEANIPITWVEIGGEDSFPVLKFSDTIHFLAKENLVGLLAGDMEGNELSDTLLTFWRRFGKLQGDHEVFSSSIPLSRAIPILIHGDEGRNYKRSGIMVLSLQGAIGHGTEPFLKRYTSEGDRKERMGLNFAGSSFRTRFMFAAMAKRYYAANPDPWPDISKEHVPSFELCRVPNSFVGGDVTFGWPRRFTNSSSPSWWMIS